MVQIRSLLLVFSILYLLGCGAEPEQNGNPVERHDLRPGKTDSSIAAIEKVGDEPENELVSTALEDTLPQALIALLEAPIDLPAFKKLRGGSNSGSGGAKMPLYKPDTIGFYYRYLYWLPHKRLNEDEGYKEFTIHVYYYGTEVGYWNLNNEELVGIYCAHEDADLGHANLVGRDSSSIAAEFGKPLAREYGHWVYVYKDNLLALKFSGSKVARWKYYRLAAGTDWRDHWKEIRKGKYL